MLQELKRRSVTFIAGFARYNYTEIARTVYRSLYFPPFVVFAAIMVVTTVTTISTTDSVDSAVESAGENQQIQLEDKITQRYDAYAQLLVGATGLFNSTEEVTQDQWLAFIDSYSLQNEFPGVSAIGYGEANVVGDDIQSVPVSLIAPDTERTESVIGFDMFDEPIRREAMLNALEETEPQLTEPILLYGDRNDKSADDIGFVIYYPVYADSAISSQTGADGLQGFVYAAFQAEAFLSTVFPANSLESTQFVVTSNNEERYQLFASDSVHDSPQYRAASIYQIGGVEWVIDYRFDRVVSRTQFNTPAYVFVGGTAASVLVAIIVLLLMHARSREYEFEKNRDIDLAKDELLSIASHQLRTPATGVKQYLGLVLQGFAGEITEKQQELLQRAYSSNNRQLDVINEILHLAKIESGRIVLTRREFDITETVRDVAGDSTQDINEQKHTFKLRLPKGPVMVNGDSHMLHMSIENLLSNAIKYTPEGGKITMGVRNKGDNVHIYVKDSGIGISDDEQTKLFVAFGRIVNERSRFVSGTGVGLYLVKHLVEMHGGSIAIESVADKGSTFTIIIPKDVKLITENVTS